MKIAMVCVLLLSMLFPHKDKKKLIAKATPHSVALSCTAPSGNVTGYNFYRGTTSGGENYSAPINGASLVPTCSYTDLNVTALATYFYTVKASCLTCTIVLSNPSNEFQATIPADPQISPPTGLTAVSQ
jgi:hypothetical protein